MLNRQSPVPLYRQLRDIIQNWIETGVYNDGDTLPAESELESQFDVSRITVRQAIAELVQEGLLERERGRGTFVRERKITQKLNQISSWTETIQGMGMTVRTVESRIEEAEPPGWVRKILPVDGNNKVTRIIRLRCVKDEPMCIMINYLRSDYVPGLVDEGIGGESLYETLEAKYKLMLHHAEETVEAIVADAVTAEKLKTEEGAPLLVVTRITYDENNTPFEVVKVISRADRYRYSMTLTGRANNPANK